MIYAPARPRIEVPTRCPRCGRWLVRRPVPTPQRVRPFWRGGTRAVNMAGNAVQVGSDGAVRIKDNGIVIAGDADPCCCTDEGACPATCNNADFATTYAISGYGDGFFDTAGIGGTVDLISPRWTGLLATCLDGSLCAWGAVRVGQDGCDSGTLAMTILGGLGIYYRLGETILEYTGGPGTASNCWRLTVEDKDNIIWQGSHTGSSPAGTYTRTSGTCTSPTTLTIA